MKKTVLTFGLIAGAIMSAMMAATIPFHDQLGIEHGEVIGYTTMVVAFLLVFFGIRSYRDNVGKGTISFGRAFAVGISIVAIANLCYVATWEVMYTRFMSDYFDKYAQQQVERARAEGKSDAEVAKTQADMAKYARWYRNPAFRAALTFVEPLPPGLVIALISAGILRRRRRNGEASLAPASA